MAVTLIRHTTPDVAKGICYGRTDLPLAESFEEECARVLESVVSAPVVITSPLTRCRLLAERIAIYLTCELRFIDNWIEMDFGRWESMPWGSIPRDELDAWADDFMGFDAHGGESVAALEARIRAALDTTPDEAIVVTHSGCIKAACAIRDVADGWNTDTAFGGARRL